MDSARGTDGNKLVDLDRRTSLSKFVFGDFNGWFHSSTSRAGIAKNDSTFDHVLKLAHVAGPIIAGRERAFSG